MNFILVDVQYVVFCALLTQGKLSLRKKIKNTQQETQDLFRTTTKKTQSITLVLLVTLGFYIIFLLYILFSFFIYFLHHTLSFLISNHQFCFESFFIFFIFIFFCLVVNFLGVLLWDE